MLRALQPHLGHDAIQAFDALLPAAPWREVVPDHHWLRREVVDTITAFGQRRFALHETMIELIGEEHAATLMEHLVPAPWRELERLGVPMPGPPGA
jgi:hypothetical protein